jgi:hypothetical protein
MYLDLAEPEYRAICEEWLGEPENSKDWSHRQLSFLKMVDRYISDELKKPPDHQINSHEAGGAWRIAFPHVRVRTDSSSTHERMAAAMNERRKYTDENYFHGYPDETESHHQIETFIYFQEPLFHLNSIGSADALSSIEDVAHHAGNWESGVPDWYNWDKHEFRSYWLGTRSTRDRPPFDYQEANHFRILSTVLVSYLGTKKERYLELAIDYTDHWCDHIEMCAEKREFISTIILPEGYKNAAKSDTKYSYSQPSVSANRAYDLYGGLIDMWRITGTKRYLECARALLDQFFEHTTPAGYPPYGATESNGWGAGFDVPKDSYKLKILALGPEGREWRRLVIAFDDLSVVSTIGEGTTYLSRMALHHDILTGEDRYKKAILSWAENIDEVSHMEHQMKADLLSAAHWYTGDAEWLTRGYAMALRAWAILEPFEGKMCGCGTRYSSKFMMELLYNPILGGADWGTRGNMPVETVQHRNGDARGLPDDVAFRIWRIDNQTGAFEAINKSPKTQIWCLESPPNQRDIARIEVLVNDNYEIAVDGKLYLEPGESLAGRIWWL